MAKSLKEALLEQMAALQERGLAPGEIPPEVEEEPSYAEYEEDFTARGGERESDGRRGGRARTPRAARGRPQPMRLRERESREPRRERREGRERGESRELPPDLVGMPAPPVSRPMGPPRAGGPMGRPGPMGPRPAGRSDMLRRNAERIQREQTDRNEIRQVLAGYAGAEPDDTAVETFFQQLAVETGALPPLHVVLEALRNAGTAQPAEVGNQVRLYYRRPRSRTTPTPVAVG